MTHQNNLNMMDDMKFCWDIISYLTYLCCHHLQKNGKYVVDGPHLHLWGWNKNLSLPKCGIENGLANHPVVDVPLGKSGNKNRQIRPTHFWVISNMPKGKGGLIFQTHRPKCPGDCESETSLYHSKSTTFCNQWMFYL
jgi:hypothetical protein